MARLLLSLLRTQATLHTPCPVQKFASSLRPCLIAKHVALPTILPCYFLVYQAASASRKMVSHRILDDLRSAAQQEEAPFYCGGYIEPSEELSVVFQEQADGPSLAKLSFPFDPQHSATLDRLVKACSAQITPGQVSADGSQDTALHLDAAKFTTSFEPAEYNVLEDARRILAPVGVTHVRLKRERLIVCPVGSSAELGQAIEHGQETSFGKLALVLPLSHTGGEIVVRHNLSTKPFSWEDGTGKGGKKSIQWLAFLNKCSADVEEVTRGCVIAILYQLLPTYASKRTTVVERSVDHYSRSRSFRSFLTLSNVPADFFCGGSFIPADPIALNTGAIPTTLI